MTTKTIPEEIAELRAMDVSSLAARYEAVFGRAPRVKHREFLWKRIAWKIQEQRFGGLSEVAKLRLDELIAEIDLPLGEATRTVTGRLASVANRGQPAVGTTIVREWRGQQIAVRVVENGFEWNGVVYRSLSAVASAVTKSHWNGRLFFGLSKERTR
jgi:hypothetical protein